MGCVQISLPRKWLYAARGLPKGATVLSLKQAKVRRETPLDTSRGYTLPLMDFMETEYQGIELVSNADALMQAFHKAKKGSYWKTSVQRYGYEIWENTYATRQALNSGTYRQRDFVEFDLSERGKHRHIKSIHIIDRVVQRSLCDNVLTPRTVPHLIYDNGASQEGKGVDFTRARLEKHLHDFYRRDGSNKGYAVLIDFHNYFGSLDHDILKAMYRKLIPEDDLMRLVEYLIDLNGETGLGIGSQISQNAGVFYRSPIDQYFKVCKGLKYYDVYMDDTCYICRTKAEARAMLDDFRRLSHDMRLTINEKKTQIVKLSRGFTFLKVRYVLTSSGKLLKYQSKDTFKRERRRLKAFKRRGLPQKCIEEAYKSWRYSVSHYKNNYHRIRRMDALFRKLFPNYSYRKKDKK